MQKGALGNITGKVHPPTMGMFAQLGVLAALAATVGLGPAGWLVGMACGLGTLILLSRALRRTETQEWGPANTVTLARLTLTGGVAALAADLVVGEGPVLALTALAAVALLLDGVDGQVARRTGTTSELGARFDMESDSVLVLVLSVVGAVTLGWWVIGVGVFRYVFALLTWKMPWMGAPLPPRMSRKVVAATQGAVLVVATAGIVPQPQMAAVVGVVLALLVWSFGTDINWLSRRRSVRGGSLATTAAVAPTRG